MNHVIEKIRLQGHVATCPYAVQYLFNHIKWRGYLNLAAKATARVQRPARGGRIYSMPP